MSLCVVSPVILSSSTLPPFTGRGPASVKCDAPSSCQFQILDSVTPTWVRTANMPETPLSITWQLRLRSVCVSPLIYSFWSRVLLHGCSVVFSLSSLARTLPGRRVCRETRSESSSPLVTSGNSNSPRTCSQVATHPKVCYYTMVSNRNHILYKTRKFGGVWLHLYKRGIWFSIKIYRYMKIRSWYQKYATSPFSGHVFHLVKNM